MKDENEKLIDSIAQRIEAFRVVRPIGDMPTDVTLVAVPEVDATERDAALEAIVAFAERYGISTADMTLLAKAITLVNFWNQALGSDATSRRDDSQLNIRQPTH